MAKPRRKHHEHTELDYQEEPRSATIVAMPMSAQSDEQEPPFERIGDILRRERERRGDDLQQIADHLCIRRGFLAAIENSNYDEFPADIYVVGFLRSYAQYLNMDGQEVVDYYRHEMEGRRKQPTLVLPVPISEGRTPSAFILIGAAIAALLLYITWYSISTSDRTAVSTPPALPPAASSDTTALIHGTEKGQLPVSPPASYADGTPAANLPEPVVIPPATQSAAAPAPAAVAPAAPVTPTPATATPPATPQASSSPESLLPEPPPQTAPQPATPQNAATPQPAAASEPVVSAPVKTDAAPAVQVAANDAAPPAVTKPVPHIAIKAQQTSWVLITDRQGHSLYDNVMRAGETYVVPDEPGLSLTTGNGAGLLVVLDGKDLPKISKSSSRIIHNIPLNPAALRNLPSFRD